MNFRRISKNTIRCVLTEEDMKEYDLKIEDFLKNKEKVHDVLEYIVERAKEEVDYKMDGSMLAMQVMPLPKNGVAITFSEGVDEEVMSDMLEQIRDVVGDLGSGMEEALPYMDEMGMEGKMAALDEFMKNIVKDAEKKKKGKKKAKKKEKPSYFRIYCFHKFDHVEAFSLQIPDDKPVKSVLYKDEKKKEFYLVMEKGRLTVKDFRRFCELAGEYGDFVSDDRKVQTYLEEHDTKLIKKSALNTLKKIAAE